MSDRPKKTDLMGWLDPKGDDFLGSGMNLFEWTQANGIARYKHSWAQQDRREQDRRMHFLFDMVIEGRRIQEAHGEKHEGKWYVASGIVIDMAIRAIIEGNKYDLELATNMCSRDGFEHNYGKEHASPIADWYVKFHELCQQAVATWPTEEEKAQA